MLKLASCTRASASVINVETNSGEVGSGDVTIGVKIETAVGKFVGTEIAVKVGKTVDVKGSRGVELITTDVALWDAKQPVRKAKHTTSAGGRLGRQVQAAEMISHESYEVTDIMTIQPSSTVTKLGRTTNLTVIDSPPAASSSIEQLRHDHIALK